MRYAVLAVSRSRPCGTRAAIYSGLTKTDAESAEGVRCETGDAILFCMAAGLVLKKAWLAPFLELAPYAPDEAIKKLP